MKKKAIITVKSNVSAEDDDLIEVITVGDFYINDDGFKVVYDETKLSGMEGTRTTMLIHEDCFELIREGTTETRMEFKYKQSSTSLYKTPYGILDIDIETKKLCIDVNENGGKIETIYGLIVGDQQALKTNLNIEIKIKE